METAQVDRSDGSDDPGVYINRAVERMLGYSREEIPTLSAWFHALYRDGAAKARRQYDEDREHVSSHAPLVSLLKQVSSVGCSLFVLLEVRCKINSTNQLMFCWL